MAPRERAQELFESLSLLDRALLSHTRKVQSLEIPALHSDPNDKIHLRKDRCHPENCMALYHYGSD